MATQRQDRRGTTVEHSTFTGAIGEITVDTDLDEIKVHDGSRAGGFNVPNFSSIQKQLYSFDASPAGTATAITVSTQVDAIALTAGLTISVKMGSNSTGASTLQWGALTAKNIKKYKDGAKADIEADDWVTSEIITFIYDGTDFIAQITAASGGSLVVGSTTVTTGVSAVEFSNLFQAGKNYILKGSDIMLASGPQSVQIQFQRGGAWDTSGSNYKIRAIKIDGTASSDVIEVANGAKVISQVAATSTESAGFVININNPNQQQKATFSFAGYTTQYDETLIGAGYFDGGTLVTGVRVRSGVNIDQGYFTLIEESV